MIVNPGSTDVTTYFALRLSATGAEATGLTVTNFDLQYVRSGAAPAAKVDASALGATDSAHADNSAIEVDVTDQPGLYRVDWPDAAFAPGVREVVLAVKCATAFTEHLRVELGPAVNVELWNATAVPSEHTAGYPIVTIKDGTGTGEINTNSGAVALVDLVTTLTTYTGNTVQTGDSFARIGAAGASLSAVPWNASWDSEVQSEVADALAAYPVPTAIENADALLDRDMSTGTDSGSPTVRTARQALRFLRNKWAVVAGTLTVRKEDDTTASWTAAVTGTAGADPVTSVDPAGP